MKKRIGRKSPSPRQAKPNKTANGSEYMSSI